MVDKISKNRIVEERINNNISYPCVMKRLALLLIFIFGLLLTHAQQKIRFFKEKSDRVSKTYTLPVSVTCTFLDGSKKRLMLEKIIGDSFVFKKYYNQEKVYDCKSNCIIKMTLHNKYDYVYYTLAAGTTGFTIVMDVLFIDLIKNGQLTNSDILISSLFLTAFNYIGNYFLIYKLPKTYKTSKWRIHEK
jgi:hypothetical protein